MPSLPGLRLGLHFSNLFGLFCFLLGFFFWLRLRCIWLCLNRYLFVSFNFLRLSISLNFFCLDFSLHFCSFRRVSGFSRNCLLLLLFRQLSCLALSDYFLNSHLSLFLLTSYLLR